MAVLEPTTNSDSQQQQWQPPRPESHHGLSQRCKSDIGVGIVIILITVFSLIVTITKIVIFDKERLIKAYNIISSGSNPRSHQATQQTKTLETPAAHLTLKIIPFHHLVSTYVSMFHINVKIHSFCVLHGTSFYCASDREVL